MSERDLSKFKWLVYEVGKNGKRTIVCGCRQKKDADRYVKASQVTLEVGLNPGYVRG